MVILWDFQLPKFLFSPLPEGRGYSGEEEGSPFKYLGAVLKGTQEFATNIVKGTLNLAGHPVETAKGIGYVVMHPAQVGNALKEHYWGSNTTTTQKVAGVTEVAEDATKAVEEGAAGGKGEVRIESGSNAKYHIRKEHC